MFKPLVILLVSFFSTISLQGLSMTSFSCPIDSQLDSQRIFDNRLHPDQDSAWQFRAGDKTYSGIIDKAIISPDKSALYFWGPTHQSADTIISVVAQFRSKFAADVEDVSSTETGFVFGKIKSAGMPVFSIDPSRSDFTVVVKNYNHQTKVAHGTISGTAKDSNGNDVEIKNGKFRVQL